MINSPRCGAKTRSGKPCAAPAVAGKQRCRMHGGAHGSGAPAGNQNALKHGQYSQLYLDTVREGREAIALLRAMLDDNDD
ncbi:MAG TPA: HGGxSTG domain-containing protein [Devosia sp.]|nr:HGGxSTG domain-containing protein [Devosia sp.]